MFSNLTWFQNILNTKTRPLAATKKSKNLTSPQPTYFQKLKICQKCRSRQRFTFRVKSNETFIYLCRSYLGLLMLHFSINSANICWSWRRLHHKRFSSCKRSSSRLQKRKIVTLKTCWRRLQDMSWWRI